LLKVGRLCAAGLTAAYNRCYVESQIIKNKTVYSQSTKETALLIEGKLQDPINFAEFIDAPALANELNFFTNVDANYSNVTKKIGLMDDETRQAFYSEFKNNPNNALQNFENNPNELDNWIQTRQVSNIELFSDFLTVNGKVKNAGNKSELYNTFVDNTKVPSRYTINENRFNSLATDNATGTNVINSKTRQEAMAGIEAENQGLIQGPIIREQTGDFEFIDANGKYWDVKAPPSIGMQTPSQIQIAGNSIKSQLIVPNVKVILNCSYINNNQLTSLRQWLNSNLSSQQLERIVEVNSNIF
jgi:hypothetical protein